MKCVHRTTNIPSMRPPLRLYLTYVLFDSIVFRSQFNLVATILSSSSSCSWLTIKNANKSIWTHVNVNFIDNMLCMNYAIYGRKKKRFSFGLKWTPIHFDRHVRRLYWNTNLYWKRYIEFNRNLLKFNVIFAHLATNS